MNWYYAKAGQPVGPIDDAQFQAAIQSGDIQPDTLVWREGLANWQRYAELQNPSAPAAPPVVQTLAAGEVLCVECRRPVPQENAIQIGANWVCAACKPLYIQKLKEGVAPGAPPVGPNDLPADPDELVKTIRERGYSISIGDCLSRAWDLVKSKFWLVVGASFISMLVQQAGGMIPFIGIVVSIIINGPMLGGLYYFFVRTLRGEDTGIGDIFAGFSGSRFGNLLLALLVQYLLMIAVLAVVAGLPIVIIGLATQSWEFNPLWLVFLFAGMAAIIYLVISWNFSMTLIMDRGLSFWPALEVSRRVISMHWWTFLALMLVGGVLMLFGLLACLVGILVAMPLFIAMQMYAYDDIFGNGQALGRY